MANVEITIKTIVDKALADLKKTAGAVDEVDNSAKRTTGGVSDFSGAMIGLNQALELAGKAIEAVKMVHEQTVGVFIDYAAQVRDLSRATGESAEQTSRMIQAADDVGISYDKLKVSLQMAARQGIDTSIESLQAMSEEYLTLAPGTERMQFLLERFGRSGADMGRLLEMGAAGIQKLNDGIESGLILSDAVLKQARAHEILVDTYNDLLETKKIAAGATLSEVEAGFMMEGMIMNQLAAMQAEEEAIRGSSMSSYEAAGFKLLHRDAAQELIQAMIDEKIAADNNTGATDELAISQQEATAAIEAAAAAQKELEQAQQSWLASTANEVVSALQGLGVEGQNYMDALAAIDEVLETQKVADQAHKDEVKALTAEYAKTGDIEAFKDALSTMKDNELPQSTEALKETRNEVTLLREELESLQDMGEINIKVNYETVVTGTTPPGNP